MLIVHHYFCIKLRFKEVMNGDVQTITFDHILDTRIEMGRYQLLCLTQLAILDFLEGFESPLGGSLIAIIRVQWNLNNQQVVSLSSIYYVGKFLGAVLQSFLTDRIGRKGMLQIISGMLFFTLFFTALAQTYEHLLMLRLLNGFLQGSVITLCLLYIVEITPSQNRGKVSVIIQSMFSVGKLYFVVTSFLFLTSLTDGNWRLVMLAYSLPALICFTGSNFFIDETARFVIAQGRMEEGVRILNKMGRQNKGAEWVRLSESEMEGLRQWQMEQFHGEELAKHRQFLNLVKDEMLGNSVRVWVIYVCYYCYQTSINLIQPFLLQQHGKTRLIYMVLIITAEFPAMVFAYLVIDKREIGRKKLMQLISLALTFTCFLMFFGRDDTLIFGLMLLFFNSRIISFVMKLVVAESYTTIYRNYALGSSNIIGQLAAAISPIFIWPAFLLDSYLPLLIYSQLYLVLFGTISRHPIDLTRKDLDQPGMNQTLLKQQDQDSYWDSERSQLSFSQFHSDSLEVIEEQPEISSNDNK